MTQKEQKVTYHIDLKIRDSPDWENMSAML